MALITTILLIARQKTTAILHKKKRYVITMVVAGITKRIKGESNITLIPQQSV
jgi:hypothetical protein